MKDIAKVLGAKVKKSDNKGTIVYAILDAQAAGDSTATYTFQWYPPIALSNGGSEDALASPDSTTA